LAAPARRLAAGLLQRRRPADLCRTRRGWDLGGRTAAPTRQAGAARDPHDVAPGAARAQQPLRLSAEPLPRPLGPAGACLRGHLLVLDRRRPSAAGHPRWAVGGQSSSRGAATVLLAGALRPGSFDSSAAATKSAHSPGTPFSCLLSRASKVIPEPTTRSLVVLETTTSLARASALIRAAICT